ncbi:MAG: hypothetical protein AAB337_02325 [Patescibacteria group bacterium]
MTFEQILEGLTVDVTVMVDDTKFLVVAIEHVKLASGDTLLWMWSSAGDWLIVDEVGDELYLMKPVDEEVEADEEDESFATYRGMSYEESYEDQAEIVEVEGDADHEEHDTFLVKQYDGSNAEILRRLTRAGDREESWFIGRMISEEDVREM